MAENQADDIRPVLDPVLLTTETEPTYALWFVHKDIVGTEAAEENDKPKKSIKDRIISAIPNATYGSSGNLMIVPIRMSEKELAQFFATDKTTGEYLRNVAEPPGGRLAWLKERMDEQQPRVRPIREVSGYAMQAGGVSMAGGAPIAGGVGGGGG